MVHKTPDDSNRELVAETLKELSQIMHHAVNGDFPQKPLPPAPTEEFSELYASVQSLLDFAQNKATEAEAAQAKLGTVLAAQSKEAGRQESWLDSLAKYAPHYILTVDTELTFTYANRTGDEVSNDELIGTRVGDTMPPTDRRRARRKLREVLRTGEPAEYEFESVAGLGSQRWYRASAGPIFEEQVITGIVLIIQDITEEHHRIQALQTGKRTAESARARDRALLNSIGEGLLVIDERGHISNANPAAASMLGYHQKELIGAWFPDKVKAVDEVGNETSPIDRPSLRALSSGEVVSEVIRYARKDGSTFPVAVTISPVVIAGKPVGAIEVFRDLTRERELDQAKEEFVSLASHQLRTPATGVKAYISMLLDGYGGKLNNRQLEFMQKVFVSNERQLQIVNDMLNVARVDAGRIIPEMVSTDIRALMQDIIDEQRPTIKERHQDLEVTMPQPAFEMVLDPKLMRMALENVISNASKYTPENGTIKISLKRSGIRAILTVEDNGVGIAKADIPKLFKRFSRIDNILSTQRGGTGLGLYLTQNIVLLHQGRLIVDSKLGKGTKFILDLPVDTSTVDIPIHSPEETAS